MRWTWRCWGGGTVLLLVWLCVASSVGADSTPWEALFTGEVLVEAVQRSDGIPGLRASFVVEAAREHIWAALLDYPNFPKMFPDVRTLHVLTQDAQGAQLAYEVKALFSTYRYVLQRRYDVPGQRVTWSRLSGDLKRIEGGWEIRDTPRPTSHLLVYDAYVDIGGILPQSMVRAEGMRRVQAMGERLRRWMEGRPLPD